MRIESILSRNYSTPLPDPKFLMSWMEPLAKICAKSLFPVRQFGPSFCLEAKGTGEKFIMSCNSHPAAHARVRFLQREQVRERRSEVHILFA